MKKNGFTLVELLAVIAILAILVILALPNVLSMFNGAKKDIFLTEAKNVFKEVSKKYISENMKGNKITAINSKTGSKLDMDTSNLEYDIILDNKGNVKSFVVSDGTYCLISNSSDINDLTIDSIREDCSYETLHNLAGTLDKDYYKIALGSDANKGIVNSISFYSDNRKFNSDLTDGNPVDVSEEKNGSVLLYANYSADNSSLIDLNIVANGKIMFPEDSSYLLAFYSGGGCISDSKITGINLNYAVDTHKVKNMSFMFAQAVPFGLMSTYYYWGGGFTSQPINDLDLSYFDTSNVTDMSCMFIGNQSKSINVSSFNTDNVIDMSGMFFGASRVTELNLKSFNTSKIDNTAYMFDHTSSLLKLDLSNFDTKNVDYMGYMFSGTTSLKSLNIKNFDTSKVTSMNYMFSNCGASDIDVSSFNTSNVTDMRCMFSGIKVKNLLLNNFNTSKVTIMDNMFSGSSFDKLDISSFNTSKVTDMSSMFYGTDVSVLDLSSFDVSNVRRTNNMFSNSKATIGYAKDSASANKLNSTSNIPSKLKFVVK